MREPAGENAAALQRQGAQWRESAHYVQAERCLLRALALEHDFAAAHLELGLTYRAQNKLEDAIDYFQLAVHFAPRCVAAWIELGAALDSLGRADAALAACRQATMLDPPNCAAWLGLARLHKAREDWQLSIDCYRTAVACDPASADARCLLGYALYKAGDYAESRAQFDAALQISPNLVQAHHNLGLLYLELAEPTEALACFSRALAIEPQLLATRTGLAHALRDLGRLDDAIGHYDRVLATEGKFADAVINRSYALLMKGDFAGGWAAYDERFASGGETGRNFPYPPWRGEALAGKRVLVYAEQGLGDEIMFASCLPELLALGGHCVIECSARLAPLFTRSFPAAYVRGGGKQDDQQWLATLPPIDCQTAIGSLPRYFRREAADFPARAGYLAAAAARIEHWRNRLASDGRLRVGIAWRGGTLRSRQFARSIPLPLWAPLVGNDRAAFYALQYGDIAAELADFRGGSGASVMHLGSAVDDLDELAAIIGALDLVISVDNTVAHLAGALGKPVWSLLSCSPEWRYPRSGEAMPWYPSMRLFHRAPAEARQRIIERVAGQLAKSLQGPARA